MALYNPSDFDFTYNERDLLPGHYVRSSPIVSIAENQQFVIDHAKLLISDLWQRKINAAATAFQEQGRYFVNMDMCGATDVIGVYAFVLADSNDSTVPHPAPYSTVRIQFQNVSGGPLNLDCAVPAYLSLYWHGPFGPVNMRADGEEEIRIYHDTTTCDQYAELMGVSLFTAQR